MWFSFGLVVLCMLMLPSGLCDLAFLRWFYVILNFKFVTTDLLWQDLSPLVLVCSLFIMVVT